jgi:hypothetical protein
LIIKVLGDRIPHFMEITLDTRYPRRSHPLPALHENRCQ